MSTEHKPHSVQDDFAALRAEAAWRIPHVRAGLDAAITHIEEQLEATQDVMRGLLWDAEQGDLPSSGLIARGREILGGSNPAKERQDA